MDRRCRTKLNIFLEITSWLLLLITFGVAVYAIRTLPDRIATHYSFDGTADGYGSPAVLLILPCIMAPCLGTISLIAHFLSPESWNMPFKVRDGRQVPVYRVMYTMLFLIEFETAAFCLFVQVKSYLQNGVGMLPATGIYIAVMLVTIIMLCVRAGRINRL